MAKTLEQVSNLDGWAKARELIEITGAGAAALTRTDRVLLNLLYERIGPTVVEDRVHEVALADLRQQTGGHESNDRLRDSVRRLMSVVVEIEELGPNGKLGLRMTTVLADPWITRDEGAREAVLRFGITPTMRQILAGSRRWGRIKAEIICEMTSKYAVAMYELIQARRNMQHCVETFSVARLRQLLGVPSGKLERGPDFTRKVLEVAKLEVNGLSDVSVNYALIRRGGRPQGAIEAVTLTWWLKEGDEYRAALHERRRPKVGRMARLRGSVEAVVGYDKRYDQGQ